MPETVRIYQGRVKKVFEIEEKSGEIIEERGSSVLVEGHKLFQDAVNYNLFQIAAHSKSPDSSTTKMRERIEETWDDFILDGEQRRGIKHSIIPALGLSEDATADDAFATVEKDCGNVEAADLAIQYLAEACEGNIQQASVVYYARFVRPTFNGSWDFDAKAIKGRRDAQRLLDALHSDDPVSSVKAISAEMSFLWGGIKESDDNALEGEEAKEALREAARGLLDDEVLAKHAKVRDFLTERNDVETKVDEILSKIDDLPDDVGFKRNKKTNIVKRNLFLLLKHFPDEFTVATYKNVVSAAEAIEAKMRILGNAINSDDPKEAVKRLGPSLTYEHVGAKHGKGDLAEAGKAKAEVLKRLNGLKAIAKAKEGELGEWLASLDDLDGKIETTARAIESGEDQAIPKPGRMDQNLLTALLLVQRAPNDFTAELLMKVVPENVLKAARGSEPSPYERLGDDPIKLARGGRGYVWKAFTALDFFEEGKTPDDCHDPKFDHYAFQEALNIINLQKQKFDEREAERKENQRKLDWMEGKIKERPTGENPLPVLAGDPRWERLREVLTKDMRIHNDYTGPEGRPYTIRTRGLRGYQALREAWLDIMESGEEDEKTIMGKLIGEVDKLHAKRKFSMGSSTLFKTLAKPENRLIWASSPDEDGRSEDVVEDESGRAEFERKVERLSEPIRFKPADAAKSRRLYSLLVAEDLNKKTLGHETGMSFVAQLPAERGGKWRKTTFLVAYTAPRLIRDGVKSPDPEENESNYLPPMARCLVQEEDEQNFAKCPVELAPERLRDGSWRTLLNFSFTADYSHILSANAKADRWARQLRGNSMKNEFFRLGWPSENPEATWHESGEPFKVMGVRLGMDESAHHATIEVSTEKPKVKYPRAVGNDGKRDWWAKRGQTGVIRLPGEDCEVTRGGKTVREPHGAKGRPATLKETEKAVQLVEALGMTETAFMAELSFPEQNDVLLRACRRAQSRMARLDGNLRKLSNEETMQSARDEIVKENEKLASLSCEDLAVDLLDIILDARAVVKTALLEITNRVMPLKNGEWILERHPDNGDTFLVKRVEKKSGDQGSIKGQRGLSLKRIAQFEDLRKRWLSLNRTLSREPGAKTRTPAEMRGDPIPDPFPESLERLERIKEQRTNLICNEILSKALGVKRASAKQKRLPEAHGQYEKAAEPVDFIVLENMSNTRARQSQGPKWNAKLMSSSYHSIVQKLKQMCEPFGMIVVEAFGAGSDASCAATGAPGFKATEVTADDAVGYPWKNVMKEKNAAGGICARLFGELEKLGKTETKNGTVVPRTALMPDNHGKTFVPVEGPISNAGINAATNIALRAVAAPGNVELGYMLKATKVKNDWIAKGASKFDQTRFGKGVKIDVDGEINMRRKEVAFIFDPTAIAASGNGTIMNRSFSPAYEVHKAVDERKWELCGELNEKRWEKFRKAKN